MPEFVDGDKSGHAESQSARIKCEMPRGSWLKAEMLKVEMGEKLKISRHPAATTEPRRAGKTQEKMSGGMHGVKVEN